jgi:hypothetical protein
LFVATIAIFDVADQSCLFRIVNSGRVRPFWTSLSLLTICLSLGFTLSF